MTERTTQLVVEVLRVPSDTKVRTTQTILEVLSSTAAPSPSATRQPIVIIVS